MNKENTDLRVVKTKKLIKDTFLKMRETMPLEKIHVRELCKIAMINKSTFYNHYTDVYDLSHQMEKEAIQEFLERFEEKNCLLSDPYLFLTRMPIAFDENLSLLEPLFKNRYDEAFYEIEKQLKKLYEDNGLTAEEDIRLTYILGGTLHTLRTLKFEKGYDNKLLAEVVAQLIKQNIGITQ